MNTIGWQNQYRQPFSTLDPEDELVAQVDIATMVWRRDQPMLTEGMWSELDEQFLPLDLRRQLAQHGLRYGLMRSAAGSRLQAALANPEYTKQAQQSTEDVIHNQFEAGGEYVQAPKARPVCTVDARRIVNRSEQDIPVPVGTAGGKARLLVPDAERDFSIREISQMEQSYSIQLRKLADGQTHIRVVPVVKYALNSGGSNNIFLDTLKSKSSLNKYEQRYEKLAVEAVLSQDQYLVVTATRPAGESDAEVWGDLAFVQYPTDQQTVLVFRGASVQSSKSPKHPVKGHAWPLAWQTKELSMPR